MGSTVQKPQRVAVIGLGMLYPYPAPYPELKRAAG